MPGEEPTKEKPRKPLKLTDKLLIATNIGLIVLFGFLYFINNKIDMNIGGTVTVIQNQNQIAQALEILSFNQQKILEYVVSTTTNPQ